MPDESPKWDSSSAPEFVEYYWSLHSSPRKIQKFEVLRDLLLKVYGHDRGTGALKVLDIGCNAGAFSRVWAEKGHRVAGLDINAPLLELARTETGKAGLDIDFRVGSATELPFGDEEFDICCLPELLEHVTEWEPCLTEAARVLKPDGILYLTTTNWLCPKQEEFNLPGYSWYPKFLKRRFEKLAVTTRPEIANHATYPAIHWFSYYGLRRFFQARGITCMDRFDIASIAHSDRKVRAVLWLIRNVPGLRFLAHICSPGTILVGRKRGE